MKFDSTSCAEPLGQILEENRILNVQVSKNGGGSAPWESTCEFQSDQMDLMIRLGKGKRKIIYIYIYIYIYICRVSGCMFLIMVYYFVGLLSVCDG